jgi:multicopper oxidase
MRERRRHLAIAAASVAAVAALIAPGNAAAAMSPTGMVCTDGPSFNLVADGGDTLTPDGNTIYSWGYGTSAGGFQLPGPVLCVNEGDTVTVHLHNTLPESTSVVFPGQQGVTATGHQGLFTKEAPPNGDATYSFVASEPGTYLYESGTDPSKQVEMGLYGALVVRPAGHPDWAYDSAATKFDPEREYILIFSEMDPDLHQAVERSRPYDITKLHNRYFTVNGREFPDTVQDSGVPWLPNQPYGALVRVQPADPTSNPDPALVRMVNAGLLNHPFHPHGNHARMIAQDGRPRLTPGGADASTEHFAETIPSGATEDYLFKWNPQDHFSPQSPLPVTIPDYRNLAFKDGDTFYSGSPYLGYKGTLPSGVTSQNACGEWYFPWHSHALNEFTNFDEGFGGMATLLRVDPLGGCTARPTAASVQLGTLKSGSYRNLAAVDTATFKVNSTTTTPRATRWQATFSGVPPGLENLRVDYKGGSSVASTQTLSIFRWATSGWVDLDSRSVGPGQQRIRNLNPPGDQSRYVGTGSNAGKVRVRVDCRGPSTQFYSTGDLLKLTYDAP